MTESDVLDRLSQLARAERGALAALARAQGVSAEDAVDCVQEGLCTLLRRRDQLPPDPAAWPASLATMVRNAARNRRRRHFLARPHDDSADAQPQPDAASMEDVLARAEEHVRLRACVAELCAIQRAVVTLRMLEEQPGED